MTEILDLQHYYGKLARNEAFSEDEMTKLVRMSAHLLQTAAYLASCHAATAESLPTSTSKSSRGRHAAICDTAAKALRGDSSGMRFPALPEAAAERCAKAVQELNASIQEQDAKAAAKRSSKKP